jgi:hypothetical protein
VEQQLLALELVQPREPEREREQEQVQLLEQGQPREPEQGQQQEQVAVVAPELVDILQR